MDTRTIAWVALGIAVVALLATVIHAFLPVPPAHPGSVEALTRAQEA
ncbi:MAG: hypothetical protein IIA54_00455 [Chloroflexi bacterium]|nr:hypothetical protein [Chloroflexota bacterium]